MKNLIYLFLLFFVSNAVFAGYGEKPYLGNESLRYMLAPYDLAELNSLGSNYMENLLDVRSNQSAFTHMSYDSNFADAYNLQFPEATARTLECIADESEYSPVIRLEYARRLAKGLISSHIDGSSAYYGFRLRFGGKTSVLADSGDRAGYAGLLYLGDSVESCLNIGFEAMDANKTYDIKDFTHSVIGDRTGGMGDIRSGKYWNLAYEWNRRYIFNNKSVNSAFKSYNSDEHMPLEIKFSSNDFKHITTVIGKSGEPMTVMGPAEKAGYIYLPNRKTVFASDKDGDLFIENPDFNYIILTKKTYWAGPGYSAGILIIWDGELKSLSAKKEFGYSTIRLEHDKPGRCVYINYMKFLNDSDMEYIFRNAEYFIKNKTFIPTNYPMPEMQNAIDAGLAAGAYVFTKYNDPFAPTALACAEKALDTIIKEYDNNKIYARPFFQARAAAWLVKTARLLDNKAMEEKYTRYLDLAVEKMLTIGYDGTGWSGFLWDNWNNLRALKLAYETTGNKKYLDVWQKAFDMVSIDNKGIYIKGEPMKEPGGFFNYFGSMPLGAWGNAGRLDWVDMLINLDVPAYSTKDSIKVSQQYCDTGTGPWAQDDSPPEYVGYSLKGLNIPVSEKYLVPFGAFSSYEASGDVRLKNESFVINPYFRAGSDRFELLSKRVTPKVNKSVIVPGSKEESAILYKESGSSVAGDIRSTNDYIVYKILSFNSNGMGMDFNIKGKGYKIDVSPDGKNFYKKYDSWSDDFISESIDVSDFCGKSDEYVLTNRLDKSNDEKYIYSQKNTSLGEFGRKVNFGSEVIYKFDLSNQVRCFAEIILGCNNMVLLSSDGINWENVEFVNDMSGPGGWINLIDLDKYAGRSVYMKVIGKERAVGSEFFSISRISLYAVFKSEYVYVKITSTGTGFDIKNIHIRTW